MARVTRHIGFCPVCERDIKVRDDVLVHHGYQRPGYGFIVGDCYGVHKPPHELSDETARGYLVHVLEPNLERVARALDRLDDRGYAMDKKYVRGDWSTRGRYEDVKVYPGDVSESRYEQLIESERKALQSTVSSLNLEIRRVATLVETWKLRPLRTVREEEAAKRTERERKATAMQQRREDKAAELVAKYQKRIDSAVRNQNMATLAEIHEGARQKIGDVLHRQLGEREILELLDRQHVWEAFGLWTPEEGYLIEDREPTRGGYMARVGPVHDKLEAMRSSRYGGQFEMEWPEALGPAKKKRRRR